MIYCRIYTRCLGSAGFSWVQSEVALLHVAPCEAHPFPGTSELAEHILLTMMTDVQMCEWKFTTPWSSLGTGTPSLPSHSTEQKKKVTWLNPEAKNWEIHSLFYRKNYKALGQRCGWRRVRSWGLYVTYLSHTLSLCPLSLESFL
jgi:hypothetical protein